MAMNHEKVFEYSPKVDRIANILSGESTPSDARVYYDDEADILLFYLEYVELAISYEIDDDVYLLLDPDTEDVVGFQFDNYLHSTVVKRPGLLGLAALTDIPSNQIKDARERIGEDRWRSSIIHQTVQDLRETALR